VQAIIAESFGVIYERNAINAAFPVLVAPTLRESDLRNGDKIRINLKTGDILNLTNGNIYKALPFSDVQLKVYQRGGLLGR